MKNQLGQSRMDTVLKMLLIAFISLLAFSSGVYFGKQLSDSDYQLKALESDFNHGEKTAKGEGKEDGVTDDEVNAISEKVVNSEKGDGESRHVASDDEHAAPVAHDAGHDGHETAHGAEPAHDATHETGHDAHAAVHPAAAHGTEKAAPRETEHGSEHASTHGKANEHAAHAAKPDMTAATRAATRVANNASPIEATKPAPESRFPNSLPKTVGASLEVEYTVQIASYPTAEAAKDHAGELVKKGFPAFPVEATVNGKTWYRVSVGSFKSQREATVYRAQLIKQTSVANAIVQRIQR